MSTATKTRREEKAPPRARKRVGHRARAQRREAIVLVIPALLPIIIFSVIPLASGVALGFTDATLGRNAEISFIGFGNFIELFGDDRFWGSFGIGIVWAGAVALLTLVCAVGLRCCSTVTCA